MLLRGFEWPRDLRTLYMPRSNFFDFQETRSRQPIFKKIDIISHFQEKERASITDSMSDEPQASACFKPAVT